MNVTMEEGTFRGLFYNIININNQQKFSLIFQAFLFGAWHIITPIHNLIDKDINFISFALFSIVYIILAVMVGIKWGLLYQISGSLYAGMADHFFNNWYENTRFELLGGKSVFTGKILGGCIDSIYNIFYNSRFEDTVSLCKQYDLFPSLDEWKNKILLLETSEEKPEPKLYRKMIGALKEYGIFDVLSGVLVGKPQDEVYYDKYKKILIEEIGDKDLSVVYNINVGHATPRCIIPFGVEAKVNVDKQMITFDN